MLLKTQRTRDFERMMREKESNQIKVKVIGIDRRLKLKLKLKRKNNNRGFEWVILSSLWHEIVAVGLCEWDKVSIVNVMDGYRFRIV